MQPVSRHPALGSPPTHLCPADHQRLPRELRAEVSAAMASSIASTLTGLRTDFEAARHRHKVNLGPGMQAQGVPTDCGKVICPLLVNVAIGMALSLLSARNYRAAMRRSGEEWWMST